MLIELLCHAKDIIRVSLTFELNISALASASRYFSVFTKDRLDIVYSDDKLTMCYSI